MNRSVVISGASRGLGLSLAKKFLGREYLVHGISKTDSHWDDARQECQASGNLKLYKVDLTSEEDVRNFSREIQNENSQIEILINNAGYAGDLAKIEDLELQDLEKHFTENLTSAFLLSKVFIPIFKKRKNGLIINIASMAGKRAVPSLFAYSASKFGVVALSQCIAKEYQENGIKSFSVCPGGMNTKMRADLFGKDDAQRQQSPDLVADYIFQAIDGKIPVDSGGDIVVRHGEVAAVNSVPGV